MDLTGVVELSNASLGLHQCKNTPWSLETEELTKQTNRFICQKKLLNMQNGLVVKYGFGSKALGGLCLLWL